MPSSPAHAASRVIEHVAVDDVAVVMGDRRGAGLKSELPANILAVGPLTARPPMIGDTATTGAARLLAIAACKPGPRRIGSMLTNGIRRADHHRPQAKDHEGPRAHPDGRARSAAPS